MTHNRCGLCSIELANVQVSSGRDILIQDVSFTLHCGELTALIGKNGAGKTTLLKAILGENRFAGSLRFTNHDGAAIAKPAIGYVPQHLDFDRGMPMTVLDFMTAAKGGMPVWLGHKKKLRLQMERSLAEMECGYLLERRLGALSGGELQRVLLALASSPVPDLLILDEPASGMDVTGLDLFYKKVTELRDKYHMAILLVSHDLNLIQKYADKVILLDRTVLAQGSAEEVFRGQAFREAFGYLHMEEGAKWS